MDKDTDKKNNVVGWFGDTSSKLYICELWNEEAQTFQRKSVAKKEIVSLIKKIPTRLMLRLTNKGMYCVLMVSPSKGSISASL